MNKNLKKDKINRFLVKKTEKQRLLLKYLINNLLISKKIRRKAQIRINDYSYGYRSQISNRCILTGRGRSILSYFRLSRITFRKLASKGLLRGIKKSSW